MELILRLSSGLPREIASEVFFRLHPPTLEGFIDASSKGKILLIEQWLFFDLISPSMWDRCPIRSALINRHIKLISLLEAHSISQYDLEVSLSMAVRDGHMEAVSILNSKRAYTPQAFINACAGNPPPIICSDPPQACGGNPHIVSLLISHASQYDMEIGLFWAARFGDVEVMTVLISHGVNVNAVKVLLAACQSHHLEAVSLLLEHGAIPTEEVIDYVSHGSNPEILSLILNTKGI